MRAFLALACLAALLLAGCTGPAPDVNLPEPPVVLEPCPDYCDIDVATEEWYEYEPSIAVNPANPQNIVIGVHDDPGEGCQDLPVLGIPPALGPKCFFLSSYVTFDGGATWNRTYFPATGEAPPGSLWNAWCNMGDPVLLFDADGTTVYYWGLGISCSDITLSAVAASSLFLTKSTDGGKTWGEPTSVWTLPGNAQFTDKQWAAIDPVTGQLAVSWSAFTGCPPIGPCASIELYTAFSDDGGETWTSPPPVVTRSAITPVQGVADEQFINYFAVPAYSNGSVHVAYRACGGDCVRVATSTDGGAAWTTTKALDVDDPGRDGNQSVFFSYPAIGVDRSGGAFDGRIYVSTPSMVDKDYDILLTWSDDGGQTWTEPMRLNDNPEGDGTDQFHHWMDVEGGIVHAIYLDRRNDPDNLRIQATWTRWDPAANATHSTHLEAPWWPSAEDGNRPAFTHYITVDAVPGHVGFAWDRLGKSNPSIDVAAAIVAWPPAEAPQADA